LPDRLPGEPVGDARDRLESDRRRAPGSRSKGDTEMGFAGGGDPRVDRPFAAANPHSHSGKLSLPVDLGARLLDLCRRARGWTNTVKIACLAPSGALR